MDPVGRNGKARLTNEPSVLVESLRSVDAKDEEESLRNPLLPSAASKVTALSPMEKKLLKRKVQWRDCHGKKLVEVLEFQPSDSSDSEDDDLDSCICTIM